MPLIAGSAGRCLTRLVAQGHHGCGEFRASLRRLTQQAGTWRKRGSCPRVVVRQSFRGCSWGAERSA